jgi:hypothetical protein
MLRGFQRGHGAAGEQIERGSDRLKAVVHPALDASLEEWQTSGRIRSLSHVLRVYL